MNPEKVAYWYFRLNGFLMLENFVIHPGENGSQHTDADIVGIRFPRRAERFIDDPNDILQDDTHVLQLSSIIIDIVIAEVKTGPIALNGPWTRRDRQNIDRVVAAIGCLPTRKIGRAATALYERGRYMQGDLRIRLLGVGGARNQNLAARYPEVVQVTWSEMLIFIWQRFNKYSQQKADVPQWDDTGRKLKRLADRYPCEDFAAQVIGSWR